MGKVLTIDADACYQVAEQKAVHYFETLYNQVTQKTYISTLTNDIQSWKHNHINRFSLLSFFSWGKRKTVPKGYNDYIQWLNCTGNLDKYLDRSLSYIFMRDLGKPLNSTDTKKRISRLVDSLKNYLINSTASNQGDKIELFSLATLYRKAQKEGIESAIIWLINKLKIVSANIPNGMDIDQAKRKLIKIIAGVVMHQVEEMDEGLSSDEKIQKLDEAIRLGYYYGLTYPFIDDLLDANVLSVIEKQQYSELIRISLLTGCVPELDEWSGTNIDYIRYIHSELTEAFEYLKNYQQPDTRNTFFEQSYVFFHAQEVDRMKNLTNPKYTNEELYVPVILKSSSSRLIIRTVINASKDESFDNLTFFYGIYNQLADDFTDMFDDMENNAVTPYTYFMTYHKQRSDLINPFELYWVVISNLIHNVYHSDSKTCQVILDRAISGLKRFKERNGTEKYNEVMKIFASKNPLINTIVQKIVRKTEGVDFFDKLLRDQIISYLKNERKEQEEFLNTIKNVRNEINNLLPIDKSKSDPLLKQQLLIDAANYSVKGNGKRLRPIVTWIMGINEYGLDRSAIVPLLKSLEYMHTASLIFDDLPSQDNAVTRRGRPTLHQVYNIAIAELTGLFLTQKAIEEQASLNQFDARTVLHLIRYSAQITELMCKGQAMDLASKGKHLTLEHLNMISFYKTGIAFEASLVMPAILAGVKELEIQSLKKFAKHAGIAFQIKDDLLDVEGDLLLVGKSIGKDIENNNSTFVTILGKESAKKAMWEQYCLAMEALQEVPRNTIFLKNLLSYMVNRDC